MSGKKSIVPQKPQDGNITVTCRFRPLNDKERERSQDISVEFPPDQKTVVINQQFEGFGSQRFTYDYVFPPNSEQQSVYESTALPIVDAVMQGFNGTVFAYGQTSSGKTFTMSGLNIYDEKLKGIIPRMVSTVFDRIENDDEDSEFLVKVGFCEIYLEKIKDLIDPNRKDLKVSEDKARGVYIAGLSEHYVNSGEELLKYMSLGQENREVAFTLMNAGSSRSHSIFITTINQKSTKDFSEKTGKLFLVDLAGSEKVGKTGATGKTLEEAKNINKSLTCLGKVINSLTDGTSTHVPYRDSKLTRVLQDSLGGNSKTALIITCSPSPYNESETMSTLRFGIRAKSIKNKPKVNKEFTVAELKLMLAKAEEIILKKDKYILELEEVLKKNGISSPVAGESELKAEEEESELIKELNEVRQNLSVEYEKNENMQIEISRLRAQNEQLTDNLKGIQSKVDEYDELLSFHQEKLETISETKDSLADEIKQYYIEKIDMEKRISELTFENESLKSYKPEAAVAKIPDESTTSTIQNHLDRFKDFESKILEAEDLLKSKLKSEDDSTGLRMILVDNLSSLKKVIDEDMFKQFIENYFAEIEKLEKQLANLNLKYSDAMSRLSSDQSQKRISIDKFRHDVEELTSSYNKLSSEKTNFRIEQQLQKKKIEKLTESNKELNEEIAGLRKNLEDFTSELSTKALEIVEQSKTETSAPTHYNNVRKPIKGGKKFLAQVLSSDMKNISFINQILKPIAPNNS